MKNNTLENLKKICIFENESDVYVIFGIARKKDNPLTNSQEIVFREVIRRPNSIENKYRKIKSICEHYYDNNGNKYNFYIYVTQNPRDSRKAYFTFLNKLNKIAYEKLTMQNDMFDNKCKRLDRFWISSLTSPKSRARRSTFLIDVDTKDDEVYKLVNECIKEFSIIVNLIIPSRNGYHILCKPFNRKEFMKYLQTNIYNPKTEIKVDDLVFVEYIVNRK